MNVTAMLHQMCHEALSNADVNAICKARGFSDQEAASRALFENFFLSETGVAAAMAGLSRAEAALLHLLHFLDKPVDVTVFERIYGEERTGYRYGTFTQRYRDIFKATRTGLVRRGILLMAEAPSGGDTQMERWRFRFPPQFEPFLPPLFERTQTRGEGGEVNAHLLREMLTGLVNGQKDSPLSRNSKYNLVLVDGELRMGERPFRAAYLGEWQRACWAADLARAGQQTQEKDDRLLRIETPRTEWVTPEEAVTYALARLEPDEWVAPNQLAPVLQVFCRKSNLPPAQICELGWRWGCLACHVDGSNSYYRLPPAPDSEADDLTPDRYLHPTDDGVVVDLAVIPYERLEALVPIACLTVARGQLHAAPDLIRLGSAPVEARRHPLARWLQEHVPTFRGALETVEARWGRQIIHENLLLARINDLSLKVTLQRAFENVDDVLFLPNDYVAFPAAWRQEVERAVQKAGHVVKAVNNG